MTTASPATDQPPASVPAAVETVKGSLPVEKLGRTLMHEHIFIVNQETKENFPAGWGAEDQRIRDAADSLNRLRTAGIGTVVDLTAIGLGRDVARLAKVNELTDINIVVATGVYAWAVEPHIFRYRGPGKLFDEVDPMEELFVKDIEEGIAGTGIHAGILKVATDELGVTPGVDRILRATARAHRRTGVPISTHTHAASRRGIDQLDIFDEEGVDPRRVIIGHSGDTTDLDYLQILLDRGATLGMDRFGIDPFLSFEERVGTVAELAKRGYSTRMVLSHDASCFDDGHNQEKLHQLMPNWHFRHVIEDVVPALLERGVTQQQVDDMLIGNPARLLTRGAAY